MIRATSTLRDRCAVAPYSNDKKCRDRKLHCGDRVSRQTSDCKAARTLRLGAPWNRTQFCSASANLGVRSPDVDPKPSQTGFESDNLLHTRRLAQVGPYSGNFAGPWPSVGQHLSDFDVFGTMSISSGPNLAEFGLSFPVVGQSCSEFDHANFAECAPE